ncbi:MAG: lysophospholipid acyltransferase family protein [Hyphomonas sp.]|uniref:lysophospholipid acyltransferase family protein n=1 Tax=Hyphomonas sp. TaxID=87 RepID=UPI003527EA89
MKSLLRSPIVAAILGRLIWAWMELVARTVRWEIEIDEAARAVWHKHDGVVVAAWHSRILLMPAGWVRVVRSWKHRISRGAMLISLSADGEAVARAIDHLDLHAIRGSAANRRKKKDKGGMRAIAEAVRLLKSGYAVCITPDGPRGPAQKVSLGAIMIAQRAGVPIVPYALSVAPAWRLDTWDRLILPLPFSRGGIVLGPPIETDRDQHMGELESLLQEQLDAATHRADMLAARRARPRTDSVPR